MRGLVCNAGVPQLSFQHLCLPHLRGGVVGRPLRSCALRWTATAVRPADVTTAPVISVLRWVRIVSRPACRAWLMRSARVGMLPDERSLPWY